MFIPPRFFKMDDEHCPWAALKKNVQTLNQLSEVAFLFFVAAQSSCIKSPKSVNNNPKTDGKALKMRNN